MRIVFIMLFIANVSFASDGDGKAVESSRVDPKSLRLALPRRVSQKIEKQMPPANPDDSSHVFEQAPVTHEVSLEDEAEVPGKISPGNTPGRTPRVLITSVLRRMHLKRHGSKAKVQS